jgi:hypothetical protein
MTLCCFSKLLILPATLGRASSDARFIVDVQVMPSKPGFSLPE